MKEEARSAFQNALKAALDTYYIGWQIRFSRGRPYHLPDADTLNSWVETERNPQIGKFMKFIERSEFPADVRTNLLQLYQQLPRRTRRKQLSDEAVADDRVDATSKLKPTRMVFHPPKIAPIVAGADLAGYSKQDAILRDSQGNLTVFIRYQTGELAYIRKGKDDLGWSSPEIFDRTDKAKTQNLLHVAAAIDSADNIHVIWGAVPEASDAKYGLLDGTTLVRQETIGTGTFARNIAVDSANHPHVVWTNVDLFHTTYNGQRWLGPKSIARGFWHPDILIDSNDDVFLFVNSGDFRPQPSVGVYVIDNMDTHWHAPVQISSSPFWSGAVAAAMSNRGDLYVAWIGASATDGGDDQVFFSRRIDGQWQSPFPIGDINWAASSTGQESPTIAFDANDVFYVFWRGLNAKRRPVIFARALVPESSEMAEKVTGWSQIIALDDRQCSDVWWPSATDGKSVHRGSGVDVVWSAAKGRDWIIDYAHVTYP